MKYRLKLSIMASVFFCLLLAAVAPASYTHKTFYVDGVKVAEVNSTDALEFSLGYVVIGAQGLDYNYNEYIGAMDEFAIYQGILPSGRIAAHYGAKDSNTAYIAAVQYDSPLLWLRFEDASVANGATAENSGISLTNGQYKQTGGAAFTKVAGINAGSNALNFPGSVGGSAGHTVRVPDNGEFGKGIDGDATVELWVKFSVFFNSNPGDDSDWARFYQTNGGYGLHVAGPNQVCIQGGSTNNYVYTPYDINDSNWHHLVVTFDSVYEPIPLPDTNSYEEEVAADNPVLWLRFEDEQPKDYSANASNRWVGYGSAASIVDKVGGIGKSVKLNGSDGDGVYGVAATNNPNAPPLVSGNYEVFGDQYAFAPNDITFELWYRTFPSDQPQPAPFGYFFQQHGASGNENTAPAVGRSGGEIRISGGSGLGYTGVNPKFDGQWHQMVVTYDENYQDNPNRLYVQLYIDGQFKDETDFNAPGAKLGPELSHIMIGAENDIGNTYNAFAGYMDEFAIYEGVLSAERVLIHYAAWQPKDCNELWNREMAEPWAVVDRNKNCIVDLTDFAYFASEWMLCNDPNSSDPACVPNW